MNKDTIDNVVEGYELIPLSEITDEAREIAVAWIDEYTPGQHLDMAQKHKLASDIMNYAKKWQASQPSEQQDNIRQQKEDWFNEGYNRGLNAELKPVYDKFEKAIEYCTEIINQSNSFDKAEGNQTRYWSGKSDGLTGLKQYLLSIK